MDAHLPRSVFLRAVGPVVHSPLQVGVIAPCEHAAARPGNSAAATSGRVRFDSPRAATRATRLHQAHTAFTVWPCLDPASILFCGRLTATYHYCTEHATLRICLFQAQLPARTPVHYSSRQTLGRKLVHYIIQVHHKTPHRPKRGANPPDLQPTTDHCSKVLAVERQPGTPKTRHILAAISDRKAATFRFWRATSGPELPPAVLFPSSNVSILNPPALESWAAPSGPTRTNTPIFRATA